MVFCHHLCPFAGSNPVAMLCSTLWLGVDLFFVLSGFLITGVLYDTLQQPGYLGNFYARRALRLVPVYAVVVALVLAANALLGGRPTVWALTYFVYASNIVRDLSTHGWALPTGLVTNLDVSHFWSLGVEEQFYLLWPLAVLLARTRRRILWLCAAGIVASVGLRFVAAGAPHFVLGTPYFELPMRLDSLLLGGALALLLRRPRGAAQKSPPNAQWLNGVFVVAMAGLGMSFAASRHGSMFAVPTVRYGYFAAALAFTALVGLAAQAGSWVNRVCRARWLRRFGQCSYGLYLIHLIPRHWYYQALLAARARCGCAWQRDVVALFIFFVYLGLCFAVATVSYLTLERYFLGMKRRFRYRDERLPQVERAAYAD